MRGLPICTRNVFGRHPFRLLCPGDAAGAGAGTAPPFVVLSTPAAAPTLVALLPLSSGSICAESAGAGAGAGPATEAALDRWTGRQGLCKMIWYK